MSETTLKATAAASGASATERFLTDKAATPGQGADSKRVDTLATELITAVHDIIRRHQVTYEEYNALKSWLISIGEDGEWPLFLDVWIEHVVEEVVTETRKGSKGTIEGPYYVPGAPTLAAAGTLPMRDDEAGTLLLFR
ncbi:dioxygenase, partial [Streptomyces sp. NPDC002143]